MQIAKKLSRRWLKTSRCYEQLNYIKQVLVVPDSLLRQMDGLDDCWKPFTDLFLAIFHE